MEIKVSITGKDVVKEEPVTLVSPENPIPFETVFLSNIDLAVAFPVETLFFFEVPPGGEPSSTEDISERVKRAVAEVLLVPYYFMAGRLYLNHETDRLELLCNNAGVLFVRATSGLMLKDLGNLSLPNPTFHHFVHRPGLYRSLADTAIFTIQAINLCLFSQFKALNTNFSQNFKIGKLVIFYTKRSLFPIPDLVWMDFIKSCYTYVY